MSRPIRGKDIGLYIHIPYCSKKCKYCNFAVITGNQQYKKYLAELHKELEVVTSTLVKSVYSIYIGGGTPSTLKIPEVAELLSHIQLEGVEEITFECNPENVTKEYIEGLKECGVNRVSVGIQTLSENGLEKAGRTHNREQALHALEVLSKCELSFSCDLILGLPDVEPYQILKDITYIIENYSPSHLSLYFLTIEPNTEFEKIKKLPDEDAVVKEYEQICSYLVEQGYKQYEISNWAKPGYESKHNILYWQGYEYVGCGLGASSFRDNKTYKNYRNLELYLKHSDKVFPQSVEHLSNSDIVERYLMTALRTSEGADISYIESLTMEEGLSKKLHVLVKEDLLIKKENAYILHPEQRLFHNDIVRRLLT